MIAQQGTGKSLRMAKIIQIALIVAILLYAKILYLWPVIDNVTQDIKFNTNTLRALTIVIVIFGIISLTWGCFAPKIVPKTNKPKSPVKQNKYLPFNLKFKFNAAESLALAIQTVRVSAFAGVAVCGLVLGILGDSWQITVPFFVVSAIVLVLTFPTEKRWNQLLEKFSELNHG